jgi:DNA-binding transcriptional LysR family regulator
MRPTLRQLESLLAVAECRSISAAARELGVSQPAVTRSIAELESSARVKLFERTASGVLLTPYGESLVRHARSVVSEITHASLELAAMRGAASGRVAVGATVAGAAWLVPSAIERFARLKPDAGISVVEANLARMLGSLRAGELDIVVAPLSRDEATIEFASEELYRDRLCGIVNSAHPACQARSMALMALSEFPWIIPPVNSPAGTWVRAMFRRSELALPSRRIETQAINVIRELLLAGGLPWIAALPNNMFNRDQSDGRLRRIALPMLRHQRPIGLLMRARATRSPLVHAFIGCLREVVQLKTPETSSDVSARSQQRLR